MPINHETTINLSMDCRKVRIVHFAQDISTLVRRLMQLLWVGKVRIVAHPNDILARERLLAQSVGLSEGTASRRRRLDGSLELLHQRSGFYIPRMIRNDANVWLQPYGTS